MRRLISVTGTAAVLVGVLTSCSSGPKVDAGSPACSKALNLASSNQEELWGIAEDITKAMYGDNPEGWEGAHNRSVKFRTGDYAAFQVAYKECTKKS